MRAVAEGRGRSLVVEAIEAARSEARWAFFPIPGKKSTLVVKGFVQGNDAALMGPVYLDSARREVRWRDGVAV